MKIYIGADHAGLELKDKLNSYLKGLGYEVIDRGAYELDSQDDYPDFIRPVAEAVAGDSDAKGVVVGKSGEGEAMCANRVKGIRAALWYGGDREPLRLSREHNDANILSIAASGISQAEALGAVKEWLETPFTEEERHVRRIAKLDL